MKVLIISANNTISPEIVFPLGAAYIATACKEHGHELECYDCNFQHDIESSLKTKIIAFKPEIIGISLRNVDNAEYPNYVSFLPYFKKLITICRANSKALIVLGGSAFSLFPNEYYDYLKPDFGIVGEGEHSFITLLENIKNHNQNQKIVYSKKLDIIDHHIIPDRQLFHFKDYYNQGGLVNIQTKRGCAFQCSYCSYPYLEGNKLRHKPAKIVVDEIEYLCNEYKIKYFFFVDSVFNYPEDHALAVAEEIINRGLKIRWSAYIRPYMKDLNIITAMKESGCKSIELGTDSLAPATLESMKKPFDVDDVMSFCHKLHQENIEFCHSLIFGAPGETKETVALTIKNVELTDPTAIIAFVGIRVFPNTSLADYLIKTGYFHDKNEISLEPVFYLENNVKSWIVDYLKEIMTQNNKWIIPGIEAIDLKFYELIRKRKKKGLMWEVKKFIHRMEEK